MTTQTTHTHDILPIEWFHAIDAMTIEELEEQYGHMTRLAKATEGWGAVQQEICRQAIEQILRIHERKILERESLYRYAEAR